MNQSDHGGFRDPSESSACSVWDHPVDHLEPVVDVEDWASEWIAGLLRWLASPGWRDGQCQPLAVRTVAAVYVEQRSLLRNGKGSPRVEEVARLLGMDPVDFRRQLRAFRATIKQPSRVSEPSRPTGDFP